MSSFTENYDLIKPSAEDYYDIQDFNENMDAIDSQLAQAEARAAKIQTGLAEAEKTLAAINEKLGTPPEGQSISSLLQSGGSVVKSIQYVTYAILQDKSEGSVSIKEVNPDKCFVIFERLRDYYNSITKIEYTLSATALSFTHNSVGYSNFKQTLFGFWVVEFY